MSCLVLSVYLPSTSIREVVLLVYASCLAGICLDAYGLDALCLYACLLCLYAYSTTLLCCLLVRIWVCR